MKTTTAVPMSGLGLELNVQRFTNLLRKLVNSASQLQNNPPDLIPKESMLVNFVTQTFLYDMIISNQKQLYIHVYCRAANLVLDVLNPYLEENEGALTSKFLAYDDNGDRANLIIGYTPTGWVESNGTVSMIGSHLDVVPGNIEEWEPGRDPFVFTIEV